MAFLDLRAAYLELKSEIDTAMTRVAGEGWYIGGPEVAAFEEEFAAYCGTRYCVGVGNGLDALTLALRAMDVGPGDEVITSSNGFIATWLAISMTGALPVPVEPDPKTHNLDPARVEAAITDRTKVLLPTHLYGQPADLDPLLALASRYGLRMLEDGAQAHGARYKGKRIGGHGDAVTWSFYPSKNLGAMGDAGALTTNDPEIAERVRTLANYGSPKRYINTVKGANSRLDPLQAAILRVKLSHLDIWNARRLSLASFYSERLTGFQIGLPHVPPWAEPVWHLYVITSDSRDLLFEALTKAEVQALVHYPLPPHLQQAYADLQIPLGRYPIAEALSDKVISIPIGPHLSVQDADYVVEVLHFSCKATA